MRGVSTVLDVAVCLLLLGAAAATLAVPAPAPSGPDVGPVAETLAGASGEVEYELDESGPTSAAAARRVDATVAGHLAGAALANLTLSGTALVPAGASYRASVRERARNVTRWYEGRVHVRAVWRPFPESPLAGTVTVGTPPPPGTDVRAAMLRVPVSGDGGPAAGRRAGTRGFDRLANATATETLEWLLPSSRTRAALASGGPAGARMTRRFRHLSGVLDVETTTGVTVDSQQHLRDRLRRRLATRLERALRERYADPAAAAEAMTLDRVRITVRGWQP